MQEQFKDWLRRLGKAFDRSSPANQNMRPGFWLTEMLLQYQQALDEQVMARLEFHIEADASVTPVSISPTFNGRIVDVIVYCTDDDANGSVHLRTGTDRISNDIVCAVEGNVTRADNLVVALSDFRRGDPLNVLTNQAGTRAIVVCVCTREP